MPRVFRVMFADGDYPLVGELKGMLGVRPGTPPRGDIPFNAEGMVIPTTGGMSVARSWRELPYFIIPDRLHDKCPEARGKRNEQYVGRFGQGEFQEGVAAPDLVLRPDDDAHALIEPSKPMLLADFQARLAATQNGWQIDED